ncbi:MAG: hypothetical protein IPL62_15830 [Caulobacteraceae bacterium]|jgi:O-glycosyl hydrolase|nr:hypothetical protein [Caulobacteraceae bacterium]
MTDLMLGDLLALKGKSSADLSAWLSDHDPSTASQLASEAGRRGESEAQFLRIAVSDFMAEADEEAWASLISAARDASDPGAACAARMIAFRLQLESIL